MVNIYFSLLSFVVQEVSVGSSFKCEATMSRKKKHCKEVKGITRVPITGSVGRKEEKGEGALLCIQIGKEGGDGREGNMVRS